MKELFPGWWSSRLSDAAFMWHSSLGRRRLLLQDSNMGEIRIELEREECGRWIAEITAVPGVMAYGQTDNDALQRVSKLLCQVLDERVSAGEIARGAFP